jgi:hypothetical protein
VGLFELRRVFPVFAECQVARPGPIKRRGTGDDPIRTGRVGKLGPGQRGQIRQRHRRGPLKEYRLRHSTRRSQGNALSRDSNMGALRENACN